jgi:hydrogenase maturation protease
VQTLIVCIGNERVCDDGIGARVGRILQLLPLPSDVAVMQIQRIGFDLIDALAATEHLVVVDALDCATEPGTCTVADVTELAAGTVGCGCAHRSIVTEIIDLARQVSCDETLQSVSIAGIERRQSLAYDMGFSDEVTAAVPRLVDLLLRAVGARLEARTMVKQTCRHFLVPASGAFDFLPAGPAGADAVWQ